MSRLCALLVLTLTCLAQATPEGDTTACKSNHPRNYPAYNAMAGLVEQPDPSASLEQCKSTIKELSLEVMQQNERRPPIEPSASAKCCGIPYLVIHRDDDSVLIECGSSAHLSEGEAPLHPRYDSRRGGFDQDQLRAEEPSAAPWKMILAVVSLVCLLVLVGSKLR